MDPLGMDQRRYTSPMGGMEIPRIQGQFHLKDLVQTFGGTNFAHLSRHPKKNVKNWRFEALKNMSGRTYNP